MSSGRSQRDKGQIGLRATVHSSVDGQTSDLLFDSFPVRVGRNALNDLVLNHPYVSQWHAVIGLVGDQLSITQMSTTNSVCVGQRQLEPNEERPLSGQETIRITPFDLHARLVQLPPQLRRRVSPTEQVASEAVAAGRGPRALEQVALESLNRIATRFLGQPFDDPSQIARFGARIESTLDVFIRCLVALRKGQGQFRESLDIRSLEPAADDPVEHADSPAELAAALLGSAEGAAASLERAFKDIMIHQVALLNGLMAGVRTLLAKIGPEAVHKRAAKRQRSPGAKLLWQTFVELHRDLAEEDSATFETIFGRQFDKAYANVATKTHTATETERS